MEREMLLVLEVNLTNISIMTEMLTMEFWQKTPRTILQVAQANSHSPLWPTLGELQEMALGPSIRTRLPSRTLAVPLQYDTAEAILVAA